jgi:hypothetical protein
MEEKRGIKNFEATHSGGDRANAEEAGYTANSAGRQKFSTSSLAYERVRG